MENYLGDLARRDNKEVFVIAGVAGSKGTLKNEGRVVIPAQTWKVALVMNRDQGLANVDSYDDVEVIAVIMPNDAGIRNVPWDTYKTTVDAVEAISGYDVLAALPDRIERMVESGTRAPTARTDGPYVGAEGSPIFLNGNSSTDPDGDALTFEWEFGDGTTGTGATPSHTYADNGTYQVKLTVTDVYGAESSTTTQVVVTNANPVVHVFAGATIFAGESFNGSTTFADAGADQWTATVDYGDGSGVQPLAISGNGMVLSHAYATAGSYTVTVTVRDGDGGVGTRTATVTVQSPAQGVENLQALVSTLERTGALNRGNANALLVKLRAAEASLARGNETAAVNQLEAFVNQVNALVGSDRLTQAQADAMTAAAERIIRSIQL
jgi:chitodextrinase